MKLSNHSNLNKKLKKTHVLTLIYQETPQGLTFRPIQMNALIWTAESATQENTALITFSNSILFAVMLSPN